MTLHPPPLPHALVPMLIIDGSVVAFDGGLLPSPGAGPRSAEQRSHGSCGRSRRSSIGDQTYGNFDIVLDRFARITQLHANPHAPCATLYVVPMLIAC